MNTDTDRTAVLEAMATLGCTVTAGSRGRSASGPVCTTHHEYVGQGLCPAARNHVAGVCGHALCMARGTGCVLA